MALYTLDMCNHFILSPAVYYNMRITLYSLQEGNPVPCNLPVLHLIYILSHVKCFLSPYENMIYEIISVLLKGTLLGN